MLNGLAPPQTLAFIGDEMVRIAAIHHAQLGLTFAGGLIVSVWSANAAMSALLGGLNVAYEAREKRNFFVLNLTSLGFTLGAIGLALAASAAFVAAPFTAKAVGIGGAIALTQARWPALFLIVVAVLAALYRYGPSRPHARWRWLSPGSLFAGVAWLAVSLAYATYVDTFGHFDRTYGPLGAVVGLMVWFWITVSVVLFGAELNSEAEHLPAQGQGPVSPA
jgi:membrane protein